ncbi:neuropeptide F receptor isoform X2 [Condylostylus longicornis]|nr:neuropeptide F receptor isoform X2 [Condylostylus longicornis]
MNTSSGIHLDSKINIIRNSQINVINGTDLDRYIINNNINIYKNNNIISGGDNSIIGGNGDGIVNGSDSNVKNLTYSYIMSIIEQYSTNRSITGPWYNILILMYCILIIFGAMGNILVVIAVVRKPVMRTARNLFILNLAISDLLLCLVTMPLTLVEILTKYWPLGNFTFVCKIMGTLQAVSIFVSTISITAIALDRYQVIVYPTRDNLHFIGAILILITIWLLAIILASPMYIFRELVHADIPAILKPYGISGSVAYCIEAWPLEHGRVYYSAFSFSFQYLLPIVIVSGAYIRIYYKLKNRVPVGVGAVNIKSARRVERGRRMKRTNCLLISIAVIFCVSWLPLNFFNLYADLMKIHITQQILIGYGFCHMIGMSSACSNPLLYGWLNENFRKEFKELLCRCKSTSNIDLINGKTGSSRIRRQTNNTEITHAEQKLLDNNTTTITNNKMGSSPQLTSNDTRMSTELTVLVR